VIIFVQLGKQRFVERLDYLTSPGWLKGGDSRRKAGYERGGPTAVVTEKAVLKFHETTKEMYLAEYYPGTAIEAVTAGIAFPIDTSRAVESAPPSDDELRILREEIDPQRLILE
jgi:glutaconate CoA-transferase subunit B